MAKRRNAPVVNNGIYRDLHQQVNKTGRAMRTVREAGYKGLSGAIEGVYDNVTSTQRGFRKDLDRLNSRTMRKILEHTSNSRAASRRTTHAVEKRLDAFGNAGGMLAGGQRQIMKDLRRTASSDAMVAKQAVKGANLVKDTARTAMDVIGAGTQEAGANAQALASESFSQRTNEDLALISQQHHDITMAKIQAQQRMAELERQHELAIKQMKIQERLSEDALEAASGGQVGMAKQQVNTASAVASELYKRLAAGEEAYGEEGVLQDLMRRGLIDQADLDSGVVKYLVRAAQSNQGEGLDTDNMAREVQYALEQMPAWAVLNKKQKEKLRDYITANINNVTIDSERSNDKSFLETLTGESGNPFTDDKGWSRFWSGTEATDPRNSPWLRGDL